MSKFTTPSSKILNREAPDGESARKKSTKKMKVRTSSEKGKIKIKTGKESTVTKLKKSATPQKMKLENSPKKKKREMPDGAEKENELQKKSGAFKVLKGAAKKVKSFDHKKMKRGVKRKTDNDDEETGTPSKKMKLEQMKKKDRKEFRKKTVKNNYELIKRTKAMWEELRRHDLSNEKRLKICQELTNILRGRAKEMIFAHDTCRVVQCLMQYGNTHQRTMLFEELKDNIADMTKSKYSKFFIRKIMKYGTKEQKNHVFVSFHGKVRKLIRHAEAAQILEYCYNDYANAVQRTAMVEEFYGPSFALFKTEEARTLDQIMAAEPTKKQAILSNMKEALSPLIDKNILLYSLVHRVFYEYLTQAAPPARSEMIELLRDQLAPMMHTRDGARVAMISVWHGTAKDRKAIVKSLKTHVVKLCQEEHGHMVLIAIFDSVDDTKLVQKVILDEMLKSVKDVWTDAHGKKVIQYLLSRRDPRHFHPDIIRILQQGDGNAHSKKDCSLRAKELLEFASPKLFELVTDHTMELVENNASLLLMLDILTHGIGDSTEALRAVARITAQPYTDDNSASHLVATAAGHMCLRKLIGMDKQKVADGRNDVFSVILLEELEPGTISSWTACNRGCFTIVGLFETEIGDVQKRIRAELHKSKKTISRLDSKGAQVLLTKLEAL